MELVQLTFIVLFYLCAGTLMTFGLLRSHEVGSKFYTIHGLGALGIVLLSFVFLRYSFLQRETYLWFGCFLVFSTLYCLLIHKPKHIQIPFFFLGTLGAVFTLLLDLANLVREDLFSRAALNSVLSCLMLGFSMCAMLLGHWYLNQPKMSGDELKRITLAFLGILGLRTILATFQIISLFGSQPEVVIYKELFATTPGIFLVMRYFWGVLGPLSLSYFIWGTVKIRSTQSATGIYYVVVVFVLIGEIISQYLTFFHGLPI